MLRLLWLIRRNVGDWLEQEGKTYVYVHIVIAVTILTLMMMMMMIATDNAKNVYYAPGTVLSTLRILIHHDLTR